MDFSSLSFFLCALLTKIIMLSSQWDTATYIKDREDVNSCLMCTERFIHVFVRREQLLVLVEVV